MALRLSKNPDMSMPPCEKASHHEAVILTLYNRSMDMLSRKQRLQGSTLIGRFGETVKAQTRPDRFIHFTAACEAANVTHHNDRFRQLWDELTEKANTSSAGRKTKVHVTLDGKQLTMGYYRNHGKYGWCLHRRSMPTLLAAYEHRVELARPVRIEHGPPLPDHFNSRGSLRLGFSVDHYRDAAFNTMWEKLEALANDQPRNDSATVTVQFDGQPVTLGFFQEASGRSRWYVHDDSIGVLRAHVEHERSRQSATAPVKDHYWFGPLQASAALGVTRDHGGFKHAWSQIAAVASDLPSAGDRISLNGPGGSVEVMRAGNGEKFKRLSISKESLPILSRAITRQEYIGHINWRANCSNQAGRQAILTGAFKENWQQLKANCSDFYILTGIRTTDEALTMHPEQLAQSLNNLVKIAPRDSAFMELLDRVRDSHAAALGVKVQLFTR